MSTPDIPLLDIAQWRQGDAADRQALAARLDAALQQSGFLMIENHGISSELKARLRAVASRFFALPAEAKAPYAAGIYGRGWIPAGIEANAFYGEVAAKPDMKESLTIGRDFRTGDPVVDEAWFMPNVWPSQTPELETLCTTYIEQARGLFDEVMAVAATALGLPDGWFAERTRSAPHTFNINRYPPLAQTGAPAEGQFRVGPHTDWGVLTILDRQPGYGGLQIQTLEGEWADAPYEPDALTINVADLLARWTGDRWRSTRHRVLPPPAQAPDEELISLIVFFEANVDAVVEPLGGNSGYEPVLAGDYLRERANAASA